MKRLSDSARVAMTASPRCMSSSQSAGRGSRSDQAAEAAGDRLDRRQRVVQLVAEHADQTLPGLALLFAQRLAEVGEHEQVMRQAVLPERRLWRTSQRPLPPGKAIALTRGESAIAASRRGRAPRRVRSSRRSAVLPSRRSPARFTSCSRWRSSKVKTATSISTITLRSSAVASSASSRWPRSVSASAFTSSITSSSGSSLREPRARIEKSPSRSADSRFASVCSGSDDARAERGEEAEQAADDEDGERPLDLGRVVAGPEHDHRHDRARRGGGERQQEDALVVGQARAGGLTAVTLYPLRLRPPAAVYRP